MYSLEETFDVKYLREQIDRRCSKRKFAGKIEETTLAKLLEFVGKINAL